MPGEAEIRYRNFVAGGDVQAHLILCEIAAGTADAAQIAPRPVFRLDASTDRIRLDGKIDRNPFIGIGGKRYAIPFDGFAAAHLADRGMFSIQAEQNVIIAVLISRVPLQLTFS